MQVLSFGAMERLTIKPCTVTGSTANRSMEVKCRYVRNCFLPAGLKSAVKTSTVISARGQKVSTSFIFSFCVSFDKLRNVVLHQRCQESNPLTLGPLTSTVKPWVIQSILTFDSMDRTLSCNHSLVYCGGLLTL